jgi:acyl-CoA dehydrogenase
LLKQFVVPSMALAVIDRAMQSFGAEGVSQDTELARRWAGLRTLRIADVKILCLMNACNSDLL